MKQIWKNKKLRNIIIIALTIIVSLWGYQEFVRHSIKKQIHELTHIEEQPVANYTLWVLLGEKCDLKISLKSQPQAFIVKPQDVPVYKVISDRIKASGCNRRGWGLYPHMKLVFGNDRKYAYYWSFKQNKFVPFHTFLGLGMCNSKFYKSYPDKEQMIKECKERMN